MEPIKTEPRDVTCMHCGIPMEQDVVELQYLGHTFPVQVMCCSGCGQVYIPEELRDKMREVEETLEDK